MFALLAFEGAQPLSSTAGIITASASVLTALSLVITAFTVFLPVLKATKATRVEAAQVAKEVREVHLIVNQQATDASRYQVALVDALRRAGIEVPADQSLNVAPTPADRRLVRANAMAANANAAAVAHESEDRRKEAETTAQAAVAQLDAAIKELPNQT